MKGQVQVFIDVEVNEMCFYSCIYYIEQVDFEKFENVQVVLCVFLFEKGEQFVGIIFCVEYWCFIVFFVQVFGFQIVLGLIVFQEEIIGGFQFGIDEWYFLICFFFVFWYGYVIVNLVCVGEYSGKYYGFFD